MSWLDSYLHRAIIEAVLVGALAGTVGVHVVLRRLSFFTMAMTHATFPGVVAASLISVNLYLGGALAGALSASLIALLARRREQDNSSATGVVLATGFALGVALLSAQEGSSKDLSSYLVGSILTVQNNDIIITTILAVIVIMLLLLMNKELIFNAFDHTGFRAAGYPATAIDFVMLLLIEVVVVTAVPAVGTILAVALIVAPAATARMWTDRLGIMTAIAIAVGIGSGVGGVLLSRELDLAAGGTITLLVTLIFAISAILSPREGLVRRIVNVRRLPS